jgi:uncharacterized membrane protein
MTFVLIIAAVSLNVWADFIDREAATNSDPEALALWTTIAQFLFVCPLLGLVEPIPLTIVALCAAVGAFSAWARGAWYHALSQEGETLSRLAPFNRVSSVMVLALAYILLGEPFSTLAAVGALTIVFGAILISLRGAPSVRSYFTNNHALGLVMIFAASLAAVAVFYKHALTAGVGIITLYFLLKTFQFAFAVGAAFLRRRLFSSYSTITDVPRFAQARAIQTIAALIYLFALAGMHLSVLEPIAAATSPLLYLIVEWIGRRRDGGSAAPSPLDKSGAVGVFLIVVGGFLLIGFRW